MKKLTLSIVIVVITISMFLMVATSCKVEAVEDAVEEAVEEATGEVSEEVSEEEQIAEPVEIVMWTGAEATYDPYFTAIVEKFNSSHDGIKIKYEVKPQEGWETILATTIVSKEGPDIFYHWVGPFARNLASEGGILAIDDFYPEELICPAVCVFMYEIYGDKCVFDECGSRCGPNGITTFET